MAYPGIFALLVGVAIGTAIYYYLSSENVQSYQYRRDGGNQTNEYYYNNDICTVSDLASASRKRRRKNSNEQCVICFETIAVNTRHKLNTCGHEFHYHCITEWLKEKKNCPICRSAVI